MIDWSRVAKPQPDGYDIEVIAAGANRRWGWTRCSPPSLLRLVEGAVAVTKDPNGYASTFMEEHFDEVTAEEIAKVDRYLAPWADGYQAIGGFLDEFWPKRMARRDPCGRGSCSGHQMLGLGMQRTGVYVTVGDPQGCAAGIYHEVGHLRLETLGMNIDDHDSALITNPIDEMYTSPVRHDILRPMCAVIHGLYAWLMLTENDLWCADKISAADSLIYLKPNLPKIKNGIDEVERYVRTTPDGEQFIAGMLSWGKDILVRGNALLAQEG